MTKIKLCGLTRPEDIEAANSLMPDYIGFVFAEKSKRFISVENAIKLKKILSNKISAVGVFVDSPAEEVARLLNCGVIDIAQLHGNESGEYVSKLKGLTDKQIIKAFKIACMEDAERVNSSNADLVLLDSERGGSGKPFDKSFLRFVKRRYFLAGGLDAESAAEAVKAFKPYAVDVSSGIESGGVKDKFKMAEFVRAVRKADGED